jgi:hypothetical protein
MFSMPVVKCALRSSLHLELACSEFGVGSVKVERRISGGASCGGHLFGSQVVVCELVFSACEAIVEEIYLAMCGRCRRNISCRV